MLDAVGQHRAALESAVSGLRADREIVVEAVRQHWAVLQLLPQETVRAAADRHHMWVWDVLRLNLEGLRNDAMITPFLTTTPGDDALLLAARQKLAAEARQFSWWAAWDQHVRAGTVPDVALKQAMELDLGDVVLDERPVGRDAAFCEAAALAPGLGNARRGGSVHCASARRGPSVRVKPPVSSGGASTSFRATSRAPRAQCSAPTPFLLGRQAKQHKYAKHINFMKDGS